MNAPLPAASARRRVALAALSTWVGIWSLAPAVPAGEPLWRQVLPRKRVEADSAADYTLTESHGPWLIMAASFHGEQAEAEARRLVLELRQRHSMNAYYYAMTFQRDDLNPGRGIDVYGSHIKRRYQSGDAEVEHAVLVGDFVAIDEPEAQSLLERIKTIEPATLTGEEAQQALGMAAARDFYRQVRQQMGKASPRGPMGHAFMTRNPLLPAEFFTAGVDPAVYKWNQGLEHSALNCPGRYTIRVATFRGKQALATGEEDESAWKIRRAKEDDPLVVAAQQAHDLTIKLRERGWEAYEFHDRQESYVAVGSFDTMNKLPDGRLIPATREAQIVVNTFGAASPSSVFDVDDPAAKAKQEEILAVFKQRMAAGLGQINEGLHPKWFGEIPFDIHPQPIVTPKRSLTDQIARNS